MGPGVVLVGDVDSWMGGFRTIRVFDHGTVWVHPLVQVCTHVFQALCRLAEEGVGSGRLEKQFAGTGGQA